MTAASGDPEHMPIAPVPTGWPQPYAAFPPSPATPSRQPGSFGERATSSPSGRPASPSERAGPWSPSGRSGRSASAPESGPPDVSEGSDGDLGDEPSTLGSGDPSRTGAVWVTATGAFLCLAAAAVFIAIQWGTLSPQVRLAILACCCGSLLMAGRRMRESLPATSGVVFHLGAFMLPVIVAAVLVDAKVTSSDFLVLLGATAAVCFALLGLYEDSVLLRWGAAGGVVVFSAGLGGRVGSASLLLVAFALAACLAGWNKTAKAWALIAGLAPVVALAQRVVPFDSPQMAQLGLVATGAGAQVATVAVGMAAALVLGRLAHLERDLVLVALAGLVGALGLGLAAGDAPVDLADGVVGLAAFFVAVEVVAHLVRRDAFWAKPCSLVAALTETVTGGVLVVATWLAMSWSVPARISIGPSMLLAGLLGAAGWYLADLRRIERGNLPTGTALLVGAGWAPATLGMGGSVLAGALFGSGSVLAAAGALVAMAGFMVLSGRALGHVVAVVLATAAPLVGPAPLWLPAACAMCGSATIACATGVRARLHPAPLDVVVLLALASVLPMGVAMVVAVDNGGDRFMVLAAGAAGAWALGLLTDRAVLGTPLASIGFIQRAAAVAVLVFAPALQPTQVLCIAGALTAAAIIDGTRRGDPVIAGIAALTLPVAATAAVRAAGGSWAEAGIALCALSTMSGLIGSTVTSRWRLPALATAVSLGLVGLGLAAIEPVAAGVGLMFIGGALAVAAARFGRIDAAFAGLVIVIFGIWLELACNAVQALDAYVAPVSAVLVLAGMRVRREEDGAGSWLAYAPSIALLGGTALAERMYGHGFAHAVVAGCVGLTAVLVGGLRRLSAPLLLGTGILIVLTAHECFAVRDLNIPTPVGLAAGGIALMVAGIVMEHRDRGPVETGRRLIDVVHQRFD